MGTTSVYIAFAVDISLDIVIASYMVFWLRRKSTTIHAVPSGFVIMTLDVPLGIHIVKISIQHKQYSGHLDGV